MKRTYDDNRSLPAGDSTSDVAKRLCAAAPLVFDAERVQGYIARGRVVEAPGGAAVSLVQPLVRPTKFGVGGRWEEHCGGWFAVGLTAQYLPLPLKINEGLDQREWSNSCYIYSNE